MKSYILGTSDLLSGGGGGGTFWGRVGIGFGDLLGGSEIINPCMKCSVACGIISNSLTLL